jgi:hypothetical protein
MPASRHLEIYDAIFLHLTDKITSELLETAATMNFITARTLVLAGRDYGRAGLATMLWRMALSLDLNHFPVSEDNLLDASACQTIDRIQLSFHSFFIFASICGTILTICLCCLPGLAATRRPVIANSFAEIALAMDLCSKRNHEMASAVFSTLASPSSWNVMTDGIRIHVEENIP